MIVKARREHNGKIKTHVSVVEGYRPGGGLPPKQRTIKSFGYLEDQKDAAAFLKMVEEFHYEYMQTRPSLLVKIDENIKMHSPENRRLNYGYKYLEAVYNLLDIEPFIQEHLRTIKFRGEYNPADIFKFLVINRILNPDSKRATCQLKNSFYGLNYSFSLPNIYRCLDYLASVETEMQKHLNGQIKQKIGRDLSYAFYDVTNCYFEVDCSDEEGFLRQKGVSKEHRTSPIAALGLMLDSHAIPVCMSVFPGNTSDSLTLNPTLREIKLSYGLGRLVVVADKGINSRKNMEMLFNQGDGFVFSQILRGKKGERYHKQLFSQDGWIEKEDGSYRYKMFGDEYEGKDIEGKKITRKLRVLIYWNYREFTMARQKREDKLVRAERYLKNGAYAIKHAVDEYIKEDIVDKQTGEVLENNKRHRSVDLAKAEKDSLYDGYFCLVTNELSYDEKMMRQAYGGLWRIEQSFRVLKSDLYVRPVFVSKQEHIRAHFLICFVALLIIRLLQYRMGEKAISAERISRVLGEATCRLINRGYVMLDDIGGAIGFKKKLNKQGVAVDTLEFSHEDEITLDFKVLQEVFGGDFEKVNYRVEEFNRLYRKIVIP